MTTEEIGSLVLAKEIVIAEDRFNAAARSGIVLGSFFDRSWKYKGMTLHFSLRSPARVRAKEMSPLGPTADLIARCFVAFEISRGHATSASLMVARMNAFRCLAETIGSEPELWTGLNKAILNRAVEDLRSVPRIGDSTVYNRAGGISSVVDFLNQLQAKINGTDVRFLTRYIEWNHGVRNPIRSTLEITSDRHAEHSREKYNPNLHIALAKARAAVALDPTIEPKPGYDRIRLESQSFSLGLGLRIGECCTLPINAFDDRENPTYSFVRVAAEKTLNPGVVPVPSVWVDPIRSAYFYLLDACSGARHRARQIEESGFRFVTCGLREFRARQPLLRNRAAQLKVGDLDPDRFFFPNEIAGAFSLSEKQFGVDGKYGVCRVELAKPVAARTVEWLDERFSKWDWSSFSKLKGQRGHVWTVSLSTIIESGGVHGPSLKKGYWFVRDLRTMLSAMKFEGIFDPAKELSSSETDRWRKRWVAVRQQILSNRGGAQATAIDVNEFVRMLANQYSEWLSKHFKECFDEEGNASGGGFRGKNVRDGVEVRLSQHLIVVWENQFKESGEMGMLPRPMFQSDIYSYFSSKSEKRTVFARLRILDEDGDPFSITPHMVRHWVHTAMIRSGPNEAAVDLWMNRAPRQGRHYDHRTAKERAERVREIYCVKGAEPNDFLGRRVRLWWEQGMSRESIERLVCDKLSTLHFTPWGTCSRELYVSPCSRSLMCLRGFGTDKACESFHVDTGDLEAKARIEELLRKNTLALSALDPNYSDLVERMHAELDSSEPLDQHILFLLDMIRSCREVLSAYEATMIQGDGGESGSTRVLSHETR